MPGIADPVDPVGGIIAHQQATIRNNEHIHRTARGPSPIQPTVREDLGGGRAIGIRKGDHHPVTDRGGAVPTAVFRDEDGPSVLLRKSGPGIEAHA